VQPRTRPTFIEAARREQIISAAILVIAELGYRGATFTNIAAQAGISPGLINYHFGSKDELLSAVMGSVNAGLDQAMAEQASGAESYVEALEGMIIGFVRFCADHPAAMQAFRAIADGAESGKARQLSEHSRAAGLAELESMFEEGQREGEYRTFATRPMAVALMAALAATPAELAHTEDAEEYGRELAAIFAHATQPKR
jgi:AcrR family transcriptional regulator